jgi:precorrin-2 C20-methyltransferase/precorrin-3B C17-methyltransferase
VLALYNPRSKARPHQLGEAQKVLLENRSPDTVVVVGRDVGGPEESVVVTTLGDLDPGTVDMRCLVLVGSSRTRVGPAGAVYTPRTYEP